MKAPADFPIAITATNRASMERQLDGAVALAVKRAMHDGRQGILVTQHNDKCFTVDLSDAVPFGLTREHQAW